MKRRLRPLPAWSRYPAAHIAYSQGCSREGWERYALTWLKAVQRMNVGEADWPKSRAKISAGGHHQCAYSVSAKTPWTDLEVKTMAGGHSGNGYEDSKWTASTSEERAERKRQRKQEERDTNDGERWPEEGGVGTPARR